MTVIKRSIQVKLVDLMLGAAVLFFFLQHSKLNMRIKNRTRTKDKISYFFKVILFHFQE